MPGISAIGEEPIGADSTETSDSTTTSGGGTATDKRIEGPLTMPTNVSFVTADFEIKSKDSASESTTTSAQQILDREGEHWEGTLELPRMDREKIGPWKAFFLKLNGRVNTFKVGDPAEKFPRGSANGDPKFAGPGNAPFIALDGDTDAVDISNIAAYDIQNALTVEIWVYPRNLQREQVIFSKAEGAARDEEWELGMDSDAEFYFSIGDGTENKVLSGFKPTATVPYHLAGVFDGSSVKIYVDGVEQGSKSISSTSITLAGTRVRIGGRPSGADWFEGDVSDARIWKEARTKTEIRDNMAQALDGSETNLVGYWKLDDGSTLTATDSTSNGNDGTLKDDANWILSNDKAFVTYGWNANQTNALKEGDNLEVADRLKSIMYDMDVNEAGIAKPEVRPQFRKEVSEGADIITDEPKGEFRVRESNFSWDETAPFTYKPTELLIREVAN